MSIVIDGRVFRGTATGIQRVARGLVDGARRGGLDAQVVAPAPATDPRVDRAVRLPVDSARAWEQVVLPALGRGSTVLSLANTAPLLAGRSVVFVHDLAPLRNPAWFAPRMRWYARAVSLAARRADRVLVPSNAVATELIERLGIRPDRITVIRPAVDASWRPATQDDVAQVRRRFGLAAPYAVLVGWGDPRKDLATALAAHRRARVDVPHQLVLVGSPHPNLGRVDVPADDTVRVLGRVEDGDLRALLSGAEVQLHPSRYEGFGLPPLEAWACGTPALIADVPAVREATHDLAATLPIGDVTAWADALAEAMSTRPSVPTPPGWSWDDAGRLLVDAIS
jgi:glycosyltransferase involved in cell wall biosynthesis